MLCQVTRRSCVGLGRTRLKLLTGLTGLQFTAIQELELLTCARLAPVGSALVAWLPVPETKAS